MSSDTSEIPAPAVRRSPKVYPGLTRATQVLMDDKSRTASATTSSEPRSSPAARSVSAPQGQAETIGPLRHDLPQTYAESSASSDLPIAYFSTRGRRFPVRRLPKLKPPVIARTDEKRDTQLMIDDLRTLYPHVCNSIFPNSSDGHSQWDITWFFDEWDFHVQGPAFLYNVILTMQAQNEDRVTKISTEWSEKNKEFYPWLPNKLLGVDRMFAPEDRERFGEEFCRMCLKMIQTSYRNAEESMRAAGILTQTSRPLHAEAEDSPMIVDLPHNSSLMFDASASHCATSSLASQNGSGTRSHNSPSASAVPLSLISNMLPHEQHLTRQNHPEAVQSSVIGRDASTNGLTYPSTSFFQVGGIQNLQPSNPPTGRNSVSSFAPHCAIVSGYPHPPMSLVQYQFPPSVAQQHVGPAISGHHGSNLPVYPGQFVEAEDGSVRRLVNALPPGPNGQVGENFSRLVDSSNQRIAQEQTQRLGYKRGRGRGGGRSAFASGHPRRSSLSQSMNASDDLSRGTNNEPEPTWKESTSKTQNRRTSDVHTSGALNSLQPPVTSLGESSAQGKHHGKGRFNSDKSKAQQASKTSGRKANPPQSMPESRERSGSVRQIRPVTPPTQLCSFPKGDKSPEQQYANIALAIKKNMIRRHFIGEDIEYLRELVLGGVQPHMSERDICDAIGEFAAVEQIRIIPERVGAFVSFYSTADTRRVLAQYHIRCKGRTLFLEVPRRFIRTGAEGSDYEPPRSFMEAEQDGRPIISYGPYNVNNSPKPRRLSNVGTPLAANDKQRRMSGTSYNTAMARESQRQSCSPYSPQDARSDLVPISVTMPTPREAFGPPSIAEASNTTAKEIVMSTAKFSTVSNIEQAPQVFSTINEEEETLATQPVTSIAAPVKGTENFPPFIDAELDAKCSDGEADNGIVASIDSSQPKPAPHESNQASTTVVIVEKQAASASQGEQAVKIITEPEAVKMDAATLGGMDAIASTETMIRATEEFSSFSTTPTTLPQQNTMDMEADSKKENPSVAPPISQELPSQIDSNRQDTLADNSAPTFKEDKKSDNIVELLEDHEASVLGTFHGSEGPLQAADSSTADNLDGMGEQQSDSALRNSSPQPMQKGKVTPSVPKIDTSTGGSSIGSSSTEPGSPQKKSKHRRKKNTRASRHSSSPVARKASASPPSSDRRKNSPSASGNHSPSASRDQTNKGSPSPNDLGRWKSEYEKAIMMNSRVSDEVRKATWSQELAAFKADLDNFEERHAQNYEKYLNGTKSGKKSAKKTLAQLTRSQKEKVDELVLLYGRISRDVDSHALSANTKAKSQSYPAFHQPAAQEKLGSTSSGIKILQIPQSSLLAGELCETVMTPQPSGGSYMRSIDSVLDDDTNNIKDMFVKDSIKDIARYVSNSNHPVLIAYPDDDDELASSAAQSTTEASSTAVEDDSDTQATESHMQQTTPKQLPKSYASVAASGTSAAPSIQPNTKSQPLFKSPSGPGITKSPTAKLEKRPRLGEWEAPEGPWGHAGLPSKGATS